MTDCSVCQHSHVRLKCLNFITALVLVQPCRRLTGPPGSGLNMLSNDRLGEQVLWLTARNVSDLSASGPVTLTVQVIGYAYWSSYQLTVGHCRGPQGRA